MLYMVSLWSIVVLLYIILYIIYIMVLVFSKCFRAGYFTFSQLKFKVNKGINL